MSRRSDYFAIGTGFLVVIGMLVALNGNFYNAALAQSRPYSFWTAPEMDICYVLAPLALYCFIAGFAGLRFPPWSKPHFPDLEIEINQTRHKGHPTGSKSNLWIVYGIRVSNHDPDLTASLTIRYRAKLDPATERGRKVGETIFFGDPEVDRPAEFPTDWLAQPLNALPQHSYGGQLVWKIDYPWRACLSSPMEASLLIEDHNSKQAVVIPAEIGNYNSTTWKLPSKVKGNWTVYPATEDANDGTSSPIS